MYDYGIGIDPGWKNLGLGIVRRAEGETDIELIYSSTFNPAQLGGILPAVTKIVEVVSSTLDRSVLDSVTFNMERYVAYKGVQTTDSEDIIMLIGALYYAFNYEMVEAGLVRAIDWKMWLVKQLFKKRGFTNPSTSLDKKFSIAAAKACISNDKEFDTDHEADAICLACLDFFK